MRRLVRLNLRTNASMRPLHAQMGCHRGQLLSTQQYYSKSALRDATQDDAEKYDLAEYYPSFETIIGPFAKKFCLENDFRFIKHAGIDHFMIIFAHNFALSAISDADASPGFEQSLKKAIDEQIMAGSKIICDEHLLDS